MRNNCPQDIGRHFRVEKFQFQFNIFVKIGAYFGIVILNFNISPCNRLLAHMNQI